MHRRSILKVVAVASVALLANAQNAKRPGKVIFESGREKPFVEGPYEFYYFPATELKDFVSLLSSKQNAETQMARVLLDDVEEVEFLMPTETEVALLRPSGGKGIYIADGGCSWRKANIRAKAKNSKGLRSINNVFISVQYTGALKGPDGEQYTLVTYDFKRITR